MCSLTLLHVLQIILNRNLMASILPFTISPNFTMTPQICPHHIVLIGNVFHALPLPWILMRVIPLIQNLLIYWPKSMSLLCWNYCELRNWLIVQELVDLVRAQDIMVFLAETWLEEARLDGIYEKLWMGHKFGVSRVNRGGGLVLF